MASLRLSFIAALAFFVTLIQGQALYARGANQFLASLERRQEDSCLAPCGSFLAAVNCSTSSCICSTITAVARGAIVECESCLYNSSQTDGEAFQLLVDSCEYCQTQCSSAVSAFLQALSTTDCDDTCVCSIYDSVKPGVVANCTSCLETVNRTDASVIANVSTSCATVTLPTSSQSTVSASTTKSGGSPATTTGTSTQSAATTKASSFTPRSFSSPESWRWATFVAFVVGTFVLCTFV
jgi:hypothetical protein